MYAVLDKYRAQWHANIDIIVTMEMSGDGILVYGYQNWWGVILQHWNTYCNVLKYWDTC